MPPPSKPRPVPATACFRLMLPRTETKRRQSSLNKRRPATFPTGSYGPRPHAFRQGQGGRSPTHPKARPGAGIPYSPDGERYPKTDGGKCRGPRGCPNGRSPASDRTTMLRNRPLRPYRRQRPYRKNCLRQRGEPRRRTESLQRFNLGDSFLHRIDFAAQRIGLLPAVEIADRIDDAAVVGRTAR